MKERAADRLRRTGHLALGLLLVVSCSTESARSEPPAAVPAAIVAGSVDSQDPAVVAIGVRRVGCGTPLAAHCTGTLIAPRLVLTAAHCITDTPFGDNLEVLFGSEVAAPEARLIRVLEVQLHPDYRAGDALADLALLILEESAPAAPVALNSVPLDDAWVGRSVRLVGFGQTHPSGAPPGVKRSGTATLSAVHSRQLRVIPGPALSCHGDSGGPLFGPGNGGEVLIGVASKGDPGCATYGLHVPVDAFRADFLEPWIARTGQAAPPSLLDGPLDASGLCAAPCVSSADCPRGLVCQVAPTSAGLAPRCVVPGLFAGALGSACTADAQCAERCVQVGPGSAACRCYAACPEAPDSPPRPEGPEGKPGGCSLGRAGSPGPARFAIMMAALMIFWRWFRKRDSACFRRQLSFMVQCTVDSPGDSHNQDRRKP